MVVITYNTHGEEGLMINIKNVFVDLIEILWVSFNKDAAAPRVEVIFKNHIQKHLNIPCDSVEEVQTLEYDFRTLGFIPDPKRFTSMEKT